MSKLNLLFWGDSPTCATGFAQVSKNLLKLLYDTNKYDISIVGINYDGDNSYDTIKYPYKISPATNFLRQEHDVYGRPTLLRKLQSEPVDILFMLQDSFILQTFIDKILEIRDKLPPERKFVIVYYYPIDGTPKKEWIENCVCKVDFPVTYTEYAKAESYKALGKEFPLEVINHGTNKTNFYPMKEEEILDFKQRNFPDHVNDYFVLNVNRNQPRKDIYRSMAAFKLFHDKVLNSFLFLNMQVSDVGGNIQEIGNNLGLELYKDYSFPRSDSFDANQGYPIEIVNAFYNVADLVISSSIGEGWGLCLWPETNLYTNTGIKKIKDITIFDKVLSSNGEYNNVEAIMSRDYNDDLYEITTWLSNIPIKSSAEHGFKVYENGEFIWKKANELKKGDNLLFPKKYSSLPTVKLNILEMIKPYLNNRQLKNLVIENDKFKIQSNFCKEENLIPIEISITLDFCKMLGLYLAEGSVSSNKMDSIHFSLNKSEIEELNFISSCMETIFNLKTHDHDSALRINYNGKTIKFYSTVLALLFSILCGKGARNKKIHPIFLDLNEEYLLAIMYGLYIGDGHYSSTTFEFSISTTSTNLAYQSRLLLAKLGILSSIRTSRTEYKVNVSGKSKSKLLDLFNIKYEEIDRSKATERASMIDDFLILPVKKINLSPYKGKLVDIQVANTNDFVAENVVVHNSSTESQATKTSILFPHNTSLIEIIGENEERGYFCDSGADVEHFIMLGAQDNCILRPIISIQSMADKMYYAYTHPEENKTKIDNAYTWVKAWKDKSIGGKWLQVFRNAEDKLLEIRKTK